MRTLALMTCLLIGCSGSSTNGGGSPQGDGGSDGGSGDGGSGLDGGSGSLIYSQSLVGPNGSDWPAPWYPIGGYVAVHDIQDNQGRFGSTGVGPYPLARMQLPGFQERDVDVSWSVTFQDPTTQGNGFYVRQSGQYIGEGYVLFLEGFLQNTHHLAFWRAVNGNEEQFYQAPTSLPSQFNAGTQYRLRFQVVQVDSSTTRLRGKVWLAAQAEPAGWQIETTDSAPSLQNVAGTFAFDEYNSGGATGTVSVTDLVITRP